MSVDARFGELLPCHDTLNFDCDNTIACRMFGITVGRQLHQSALLKYSGLFVFFLAMLLEMLMMHGVISAAWAWLSMACHFLTVASITLHFNLTLLSRLLRCFEIWFTYFYLTLALRFLMPDLCQWDARTSMFVGWWLIVMQAFLVDSYATINTVDQSKQAWPGCIALFVYRIIAVQRGLFGDIHPRDVSLGVTTFNTQALLVIALLNVCAFIAKVMCSTATHPHHLIMIKATIQRSDLFRQWQAASEAAAGTAEATAAAVQAAAVADSSALDQPQQPAVL